MKEKPIRQLYLVLAGIRGLGIVSQNRLLQMCGDIGKAFAMSEERLLEIDRSMDSRRRIGDEKIHTFAECRNDQSRYDAASDLMQACESKGIAIITIEDETYPARLHDIINHPLVIYALGDLRLNHFEGTVGVVGARRCSREGKEQAIQTAQKAVLAGKAVISGMAKGIDSYAHTAAVKEEGYTVAVLGCGPDICYPKEHRALYEKIIFSGCVLSEYQPGELPRKYMFPQRNRLIAALSDELYVIDAGRNSGTHTTVEAARQCGKRVSFM